jgi:hypothetical protein
MELNKVEQDWNRQLVETAMNAETRPMFWVTLNINRRCPLSECQKRLDMLFYRLHRSLFRSQLYEHVPTIALMQVLATATELTKAGNPHLHLVVATLQEVRDKFERRLAAIWNNFFPLGSTCLKPVQLGQKSLESVAWYSTKDTDRPVLREHFRFCPPLALPNFGGPIARPSRSTRAPDRPANAPYIPRDSTKSAQTLHALSAHVDQTTARQRSALNASQRLPNVQE